MSPMTTPFTSLAENTVFKKIHAGISDEQTFTEKQRYVALGLDKKNTGPIEKIWEQVQALWAAVKNPDVPWYQKALPLAGLVYLVSPLDLVPDVLPVVGLLDDAAIIVLVLKNVGFVFRQISDKIIERKITDAKTAATIQIDALYADYKRNVLVSVVLNALVIAITLIAHFFSTINAPVICIVSIIPTIMMVRGIYRAVKTLGKVARNINRLIRIDNNGTVIILDITYWRVIRVFRQKMQMLKSVPEAIKEAIRFLWRRLYAAITNDATRTLHSAGTKIEIIKSPEEIEESIVKKFYPLICDYLLRSIVYKIAALFAFYAIFLLLLKQQVFAHTVHMGALEVMLYPFTVALPAVLSVITRGST